MNDVQTLYASNDNLPNLLFSLFWIDIKFVFVQLFYG